jgi:hypothetical protein
MLKVKRIYARVSHVYRTLEARTWTSSTYICEYPMYRSQHSWVSLKPGVYLFSRSSAMEAGLCRVKVLGLLGE